jgi:DNA mismatch repair protein MutS2
VAALAELDLAFAKAKYASALGASQPRLLPCQPAAVTNTRSHPGSVIALRQARHPLLDPAKVVPIDVELPPDAYVLVITGPNTGGKTVSLKTIGLAVLMAQSGLHILAEPGSMLSVFSQVFADIGDEQSIEQSLSTFSGHVTNITRILRQLDERSLLILDELGAGTDPVEGAALARALLNFVLDKGVTTLGTTHYPELKAYAHATPGVVNGSVEFDLQTLAPTYRLLIGLPGRSNALAIAARLGLDESIVAEARSFLGTADVQTDTLLAEIHKQRERILQEGNRTAAIRADVEKLQNRLQNRLNQIEKERQVILERAQADAQAEIETLQTEIRQMRQSLQAAGIQPTALQALQEKARELSTALQLSTPGRAAATSAEPLLEPTRRALRLQDRVQVGRLNAAGVINRADQHRSGSANWAAADARAAR